MILTKQVKNTIATVAANSAIKGSEAGLIVELDHLLAKEDEVTIPPRLCDFALRLLNEIEIKGQSAARILEAQIALSKLKMEVQPEPEDSKK